MEHPAADREETVAEHYPVDDITVRTPCELLYQLRKKLKVVTHGIAEVPVQGGTIHGMAIPEGYARVMIDRVEKGWENLDLEIPRGDGEEELGQGLHTLICWNKWYIREDEKMGFTIFEMDISLPDQRLKLFARGRTDWRVENIGKR